MYNWSHYIYYRGVDSRDKVSLESFKISRPSARFHNKENIRHLIVQNYLAKNGCSKIAYIYAMYVKYSSRTIVKQLSNEMHHNETRWQIQERCEKWRADDSQSSLNSSFRSKCSSIGWLTVEVTMVYIAGDGRVLESRPWGIHTITDMFWGLINFLRLVMVKLILFM